MLSFVSGYRSILLTYALSSLYYSCEHGSLQQCSTKSARARRRVMDKQAWRVLKRLYPESVQLEAHGHLLNGGGCLLWKVRVSIIFSCDFICSI